MASYQAQALHKPAVIYVNFGNNPVKNGLGISCFPAKSYKQSSYLLVMVLP